MVGDIAVAFEGSEDFSGEGAFEGAVDGCECPAGGEVAVAVVAASLSRRTPRTFGSLSSCLCVKGCSVFS